jgi:phenylacetate-CoA ligase
LAQILDAVRRIDPTILFGLPGVLVELAARHRAGGRRLRPRLVFTGGEELTVETRQALGEGFGAPVFDIYGAHEFNLLAWECARTGLYHVCDDAVALEVLTDRGPAQVGEEGEVVATALHSYANPFLRYRVGDRAVRGPTPCPCGLPVSTLERIRGRQLDYYRLPDGRLLHHFEFLGPAMVRSGVRPLVARYQSIQEREDLFVLRFALTDSAQRGAFQRLHEELVRTVGPGVEIRFEFVDEFDFEPSGKFRVALSKVAR